MKLQSFMHVLIVVLGSVLGVMVYVFVNGGFTDKAIEPALSALLGIIVAFAVFQINRLLDKVLPWKRTLGLRLFSGLFLDGCIALFIIIISSYFYGEMLRDTALLKTIIILITISLIYNIIHFIFFSYYEYVRKKVEEQTARKVQRQLQFSTLKSQLSPHFLFNSLNALSSLFYRDVDDAEKFIRSLSNSLTFVLKNYKTSTVSVKEELEMVMDYAKMMRMRFGDCLYIDVDLNEEARDLSIPPLSLQMLVENAIKHNHMDLENPLKIIISQEEGFLKVANRKNVRVSVANSTKIGLKNIEERYKLLSSRSILVQNADLFTVKLPLLS